MVSTYDFQNKVAVVTGGAQSIGLLVAQTLAQLGAKVVIGDIRSSGALEVSKLNDEIGAPVAIFQHCDVTDTTSLCSLIDLATTHFGHLDILVNNAGVLDKPWDQDPTGACARSCVDINLRSVVDGTTHALHIWNQHKSAKGVVVNLASSAGYFPLEFMATYAATKAAVIMYTKSLSGLAPKVRVNAVAPTWVDTKLLDAEHVGRDHFTVKYTGILKPKQVVDQIIRLIEDESLAGDVVVIRKPEEPVMCKLPKASDLLPGFKQK
ncbi:hypothetical protein EV180_004203 [Coemansia sp. RSA 518]|nr:hypothetical protein GGH15_001777 [Coemansia sp. RSA 562]KAJ2190492.1 hypothetical protein EV181_000982 [Coemansia sp. RSA 532]KAJ2222806.1 hypothetical protein EV180_004203 [Coemansia sp. RSA 518]KAJ2247222.1 hypothetical protein GGH97_002193 [Coemansia sp. RSA 475]